MCKKLLLLLFWAIALSLGSAAQKTLTVYDGTGTSSQVPIHGLYTDDSYLKCEYVIPEADLADMDGATITQLTWYLNAAFTSGGWAGANFQIFLKEVDNATLDAYSGLSGATIVYEGAIDGDDTELTIEFATPYTYGGGNLLVGVYNTVKGTSFKAASFYGQAVTGASGQGKDGSSLDAVTFTQRNFIPKTMFTYAPAGMVVYSKPKNLAVSGITTESANLTWEAGSTETAWNVGYKKHADEQWTEFSVSTTSATLTDLDRATIYDVRVQADYGTGNLSNWTAITSFGTAVCDDADEGQISYELTDSYGDGWNGNAVNIVHHDTGIVIATLTIASGSSATGTVDLCYGETYDIVWVRSNYPQECSFVISDENGVIYEYAKTDTGPTAGVLSSFTLRRTTCHRPTALTAGEVAYNAATLTWTPGDEDQDNWQVAYGTGDDFDPDAEGVTLFTANINPTLTLSNLAENTTYHAYVRSNCGEGDVSAWSDVCTFTTPEQFPTPTALTVADIKARGATATWTGEAQSYTLRYRTPASYETFFFESFENGMGDWKAVDSDGDGLNWQITPASSLTDIDDNPLQAKDGAYFMVTRSYYAYNALTPDQWLISPKVDLKGTLRYWLMDDGTYSETYRIYVSTTGTELEDFQPLTDDLQSPKNFAWTEYSHDLSQFEGQQGYIAFRHYNCTDQNLMFLDAVGIYGDAVAEGEWTVIENATSPCAITGLNPLTTYEVQVQANYAGGASQWTDLVQFTTADENVMPTGLTVSEVKANSAKAQWTGVQDAYNLRYRSKAYTFFEDFEAGIPKTWGNIDADGDNNKWYSFAPTNPLDAAGNPTVLGTACATSASNAGSALTPDNWLVTPLVDLGGTLSVWLRVHDPDWAAEHFAIYVSTTGNTAEDFTTELVPETEATGVYVEYTADLSEYAGQQGYIAIRHFNCTDQFRLNVDNFGVYGEVGEWVTVQNVTSPYTISGLMASSHYEVEVQGIVGEQTTAWTDAVVFATAQGLLGDINGDDKVDVGDVNIAINIILGKDSPANHPGDADVSGDGQVDVSDINAIVNIILGKN